MSHHLSSLNQTQQGRALCSNTMARTWWHTLMCYRLVKVPSARKLLQHVFYSIQGLTGKDSPQVLYACLM